jgi:thymidine kinase
MSKLELYIGPMFSGKTTELIRQIRLLKIINKKILIVKPIIDNRYDENKIVSHNMDGENCIIVNKLNEISNDTIKLNDVIIIDEGHFFDDLKENISYWLNNNNIHIIIGGLDGDYKMNKIGQILELIPIADKCIKLNSICLLCNDGTKAPFTLRKIKSSEQICIGGNDIYISVCRKHHSII